jgi:hypothetical protein
MECVAGIERALSTCSSGGGRGTRGARSWRDCAIVSQPYNHVFANGAFDPAFLAAAQALLQRRIGVRELSSWLERRAGCFPTSTRCTLLYS